jgi:hypothetical protein
VESLSAGIVVERVSGLSATTPGSLVFLCGARDFHAIDWYRRAKELLPEADISILTDLIAGEEFKKLVDDRDKVHKLVIIDRLLFRHQSHAGNVWRNLVKLLVFPVQVALVRRFARCNPGAIYYAHAMYYLFLGMAAGIPYVGRPQGSDVLIKPYRSKLFRYFAVKSMAAAKAVIVDSEKMRHAILDFSGVPVNVHVIRNGIDIKSIDAATARAARNSAERTAVMSIRGFTPLYRIKEIFSSRNASKKYSAIPLTFIYPFYENTYKNVLSPLVADSDVDLGRVDKTKMYELLAGARLVISIPESDSSPRSVFEAVFCGCAVAITRHPYYDELPDCMKERIILVDMEQGDWFDRALDRAVEIARTPYRPSERALKAFNQDNTFREMQALLFQ